MDCGPQRPPAASRCWSASAPTWASPSGAPASDRAFQSSAASSAGATSSQRRSSWWRISVGMPATDAARIVPSWSALAAGPREHLARGGAHQADGDALGRDVGELEARRPHTAPRAPRAPWRRRRGRRAPAAASARPGTTTRRPRGRHAGRSGTGRRVQLGDRVLAPADLELADARNVGESRRPRGRPPARRPATRSRRPRASPGARPCARPRA